MFRLISLIAIMLCLALSTGCKMCASHTDILGSPVPNASADGYHRAGSYYGGYSDGGYHGSFSSTATPQKVYDTEFSMGQASQRQPVSTTRMLPPPANTSTQNNRVVPAVIKSEYSPAYASGMVVY